jgi:hypothetical protein
MTADTKEILRDILNLLEEDTKDALSNYPTEDEEYLCNNKLEQIDRIRTSLEFMSIRG